MLRRQPIFSALEPQLVSSGLQPDLHNLHRLLWQDSANVTFFAGRVKRRLGSALMYSAGVETIRGLSQQQASDGTRWVWAASGGDVTRWYGPAAEAIVTMPWQEDETVNDPATLFDFTHYGDWTIINSSVGKAQLYKPPAAAEYSEAPGDVVTFTKKLSFILAVGHGARGTQVSWSDADNIEVWIPTASNLAGSMAIDDFDTRIRASSRIGQSIAVYAEDQLALVTYIADPYYFGQKVVLDGIGAVGKGAVCSDGKANYGVGHNGIWWTDANTYRYIDEGFIHDYIQDNVNWAQKSKIIAVRNDYTGCIEFHFPMHGSGIINEGWSWDPRTGGWCPIPPFPAKDERRLFTRPILGTESGEVHQDQLLHNVDLPLTLETRPLLMQVQGPQGFADIHTASRVDEVVLLLKEATSVDFQIGSAQSEEKDFHWSGWMELDPSSPTYLIEAMPDGVYWKLRFRSTADQWKFDLQGFLLFGVVEGSKRGQQ